MEKQETLGDKIKEFFTSALFIGVLAGFVIGIGKAGNCIYKKIDAGKKEKQEQIAAFSRNIDFLVDSASSADDDSYWHYISEFEGSRPKEMAVRQDAIERLRNTSQKYEDSLGSARINECLGDAYLKMLFYTKKDSIVPLLTSAIAAYQKSMDMSYYNGISRQNFQYNRTEEKRDAALGTRNNILNPTEKRKDETTMSAQDVWGSLIRNFVPYEPSHPR